MEKTGLVMSTQAHLGDPVFVMSELPDWPTAAPILGLPRDPAELEQRIARLELRVGQLDHLVADLQSHTVAARWQSFILWLRQVWPWR